MTIDSFQLKSVAKFIDGLNKLSADTGITIYAPEEDAQLRVEGMDVGLRLCDSDYEDDGYQVAVDSGDDAE